MNTATNKKQKSFSSSTLVNALYWVVAALVLFFMYLNIQPYAVGVRLITGNGINHSFIINLILDIPIIGGLLGLFIYGFNWIVGFLLWAAIQTIQLFPIVLRRDRRFMQSVISECDSHSKYQIKENDDPALKALKRWYNKFPALTISRSRTAALFAYVVDFSICMMVYPPVQGGFDDLMFVVITGQVSRIDWGNVIKLLLTIFIVELCVKFLFWLAQIKYYFKMSQR
ncbi:hypothetical protein [Nostoc sp. CCY 9925]|uniref:hypothetical protein n=1 Tax=Nostoc sp. CCY 9925 TaxID=3103865 RepID=UPI0039C6651C